MTKQFDKLRFHSRMTNFHLSSGSFHIRRFPTDTKHNCIHYQNSTKWLPTHEGETAERNADLSEVEGCSWGPRYPSCLNLSISNSTKYYSDGTRIH